MVGYLLNIAYATLMLVASPWLIYAAIRKGKYREGCAEKLWGRVPSRAGNATCVWFHAVSVGEVKLLVPLVRELSAQRPDWEFVISTTTRTGRALAREKFPDRVTFYCPLDFTWAVRGALRRIRPDYLVLAELELWPNLIRLAHRQGAQVAVVNGRMSDNSFPGYRRIRPLIGWLLRHVDLIACQNEQYAERFRQLGASDKSVRVTGSIKFDDTETNRDHPASQALRELVGISAADVVFTAGSTHAGEEEAALEAYVQLRRRHPELRLVLVPRHPERFAEVARLLADSGLPWQRRSQRSDGAQQERASSPSERSPAARQHDSEATRVLLVDTVGELSAWWGVTDIALVGGSLIPHGGQNMIEPAAFGCAICFGPHTQNFRDVVAILKKQQAAVVVEDASELKDFVQRCLVEPNYPAELGSRAAGIVAAGQGATKRTTAHLLALEMAAEPEQRVRRGAVDRHAA